MSTAPTLWLHGAGLNAASWGEVPGHARDLPGHGATPRAPTEVAAYAERMMPDGPVALVGHSLGGMVSLEIARRIGPRCKALVLLDAPLWIVSGLAQTLAGPAAELVARIAGPSLVGDFVANRTAPGPGRGTVREAFAEMTPEGLRDAMLTALAFDARPFLGTLTCPVLALWAKDALVTSPAMHVALAEALPNAQAVHLPLGHMMHLDDRALVMGHILPFLEAHR